MGRPLTPAQEATVERLAAQYDSVMVASARVTGFVKVVALDDPDPCGKHADDGVRLDCPLCCFEQRASYLIDEAGGVRGGGAL